ncbi:endoplasmic reticulum oxidoreductin-1-like [Rosa rugosa]|uniref:endoplasmic reticulum oxidoreductin-1-like n=1 Tax=Rosa rugosa TaxID=74645 RepID=UPI002B409237|nr:endoplasmic reticulum oxidoreductin-1-like [Rosa rugosa]
MNFWVEDIGICLELLVNWSCSWTLGSIQKSSSLAKLWCDCPFWTEDGMCLLRDCSVYECPENEFSEPFKRPFHRGLPSDSLVCQDDKLQGCVDRTLDSRAFRGWIETDNPWTNDDETDNEIDSVNF